MCLSLRTRSYNRYYLPVRIVGEVYGVRVPVLHEVVHAVFPAVRHIDRTDIKHLMREECRREGPHSLALSHGFLPLDLPP